MPATKIDPHILIDPSVAADTRNWLPPSVHDDFDICVLGIALACEWGDVAFLSRTLDSLVLALSLVPDLDITPWQQARTRAAALAL